MQKSPAVHKTQETKALTALFNKLNTNKAFDATLHTLLAGGGLALVFSGVNDAETNSLAFASGKIITGGLNTLRNLCQVGLFLGTSAAKRNKNQIMSNNVSAVTNLPQAILGLATGRWADSAAAAIAASMYRVRAKIYEMRLKASDTLEPAQQTQRQQLFSKHANKVPAIVMAARGAVQVITAPVSGVCYILVGHLMLCADFNDSSGNNEQLHKLQTRPLLPKEAANMPATNATSTPS